MSIKLLWTGLTLTMASGLCDTSYHNGVLIAGLIIMVIGCIVMWLDK